MRVHVVADQSVDAVQAIGAQAECQTIANAWTEAAPHTAVSATAFASDSSGVLEAWQFHVQSHGGLDHTALVVAMPQSMGWQERFAQQCARAIESGATRIVASLPRYAFPDAGLELLEALDRELPGARDISESPASGFPDNDRAIDPHHYLGLVKTVGNALRTVDVVVAYSENVPLVGMHGASGTAALLGDLDPSLAQARERVLSGLVHSLNTETPAQGAGLASSLLALADVAKSSYKDLARHDAAGAAGGAGFALLASGARALPLSRALAAQFDVTQAIAGSDLIVVKQDVVDGRTHHMSTLGAVCEIAMQYAVPVIVMTREQIMSNRELAANGISSCYTVPTGHLGETSARLALSWTPLRNAE